MKREIIQYCELINTLFQVNIVKTDTKQHAYVGECLSNLYLSRRCAWRS